MKRWLRRILISAVVLALGGWLLSSVLMRSWTAKPPPLPADVSIMQLKPELRGGKGGAPEAKGEVGLERGREAQDAAAVEEERAAPFHGFFRLRAGGVHEPAQTFEDRPGKRGRLGDIGVNAWVGCHDRYLVSPPGRPSRKSAASG